MSYVFFFKEKRKEQWIKLKDNPNIPSYCKLQDSISSSECKSYFQIDDTLNPIDVLSKSFRNIFTEIAAICGESIRIFTDETLGLYFSLIYYWRMYVNPFGCRQNPSIYLCSTVLYYRYFP